MESWQALGRNYTAVQKAEYQKGGPGAYPAHVVFHLLNLDTVDTGIRVRVTKNYPKLRAELPPFGGRYSNYHSYLMNAVPVQLFRNEERVKAWKEFINAMETPAQ